MIDVNMNNMHIKEDLNGLTTFNFLWRPLKSEMAVDYPSLINGDLQVD